MRESAARLSMLASTIFLVTNLGCTHQGQTTIPSKRVLNDSSIVKSSDDSDLLVSDSEERIEQDLHIDVRGLARVYLENTYSNFQLPLPGGSTDGCIVAVYELSDLDVKAIEAMGNQKSWQSLPLPDVIKRGVAASNWPNRYPLINESRGFYRFVDRYDPTDRRFAKPFADRSSFNFSIGLLDLDRRLLFVVIEDT